MKRPTKKSSVTKSKSKKKSPLLKYQTAGFGGSDSYSGFDKALNYEGLDFNFTPSSDPALASPQRYEGASVMPGSSSQAMPTASSPSAGAIAGSVAGAVSGIGSSVMAGLQDTSVKDPSGYFNQSTVNRIERARKGQKEAGIASGIGTTISSIAPMTGPAAPFLLAIGALTTAGSEIARASYKGTEGKTIGDYDERVRQRNLQKQRRNRILQQQKMYSQPNYYDLAEKRRPKKYMGGGFTKVTGPSHENGGVPMDLSGDGVIDSELEGGEIIETMKGGGRSGQKYIWSDHLKKGGKSFAKTFEEMKRKGKSQAEIEGLRVDQEIAANRDPNMLYAKYGGMTKYQTAGLEAITPNYRLQYDSIPYPNVGAAQMYNDPYANKQKYPVPSGMQFNKRDSILGKRDRGIELTAKEIQYLGPESDRDFGVGLGRQPWGVDPNKVDRVQRIESKQNGGRILDPSYGDLMKGDTHKYTESQTSNAVNSLYNRRKPVETKRAFEDHSEFEQQLIGLVSGSSTKPKYTPYVPQYQNLQNQSYRRNGVDVTQRTPNYASPNMSDTINYTDATGKKITKNNPYANFEGSTGNTAQRYNDPFADKNLHPVPKDIEFTRRDSLLGIRDRNLPLSAEEIKYLGAEADRNYKVPVRKNGGMMKYGYGGKMNYMEEGGKLPKDVLKSRLESHMSEGEAQNYLDSYKGGGLWANIHAKRERIKKGSGEKMRKPGSEGAPTAKALRESKRDGGLPKYQTGTTYTVQSGDTLSGIAQAQGIADYNEIYNLNKGVIGSDPNMIKPGQVLTIPGAAPAAPASTVSGMSPALKAAWTNPPLKGTGLPATTPATTTPPPKGSKSIRKELPYGIAAAGALGQIATVASIDAKKGVAPINVAYIKPPEEESFTRVRDTGKAGREAERRATIREINKATGPQKFALADQARATLLREEEKAKANIDAMNTKIEQAEITLNTSRKDSIDFKNSEIALQNATSARNEALRVLESVNNKKKAYGDIFRGATKDILQYYAAEELARATEGERGVMGRFYNNPYDKFAKQYKKQNPGASPQETYAAFQTSLTV